MVAWSCLEANPVRTKYEEDATGTRKRAHPSCGGVAGPGRTDSPADEGGGQGGPTRGFRHLRSQPYRFVRRERHVPSSASLSGRDREAEEVGPHNDLHPHSGNLHSCLHARAGGWLAGGHARPGLDTGIVRRSAQATLDGSPTLAVGGSLPGYGLARRDPRIGHLPRDTFRRDSLDPRRRSRLQRRRHDLRPEAPQPGAWSVRVPRAVAPLRPGGKRLSFLGDATLHRTDLGFAKRSVTSLQACQHFSLFLLKPDACGARGGRFIPPRLLRVRLRDRYRLGCSSDSLAFWPCTFGVRGE